MMHGDDKTRMERGRMVRCHVGEREWLVTVSGKEMKKLEWVEGEK